MLYMTLSASAAHRGDFQKKAGSDTARKLESMNLSAVAGLVANCSIKNSKYSRNSGISIPSVEASIDGRVLVKTHSVVHNEALAHLAIDEICTKELYEYFNWWAESEEFKY
jgi:hypothetical protein